MPAEYTGFVAPELLGDAIVYSESDGIAVITITVRQPTALTRR
jgi:hypothetical protein